MSSPAAQHRAKRSLDAAAADDAADDAADGAANAGDDATEAGGEVPCRMASAAPRRADGGAANAAAGAQTMDVLDAAAVRRMARRLEQLVLRNQQMRTKFPAEPERCGCSAPRRPRGRLRGGPD